MHLLDAMLDVQGCSNVTVNVNESETRSSNRYSSLLGSETENRKHKPCSAYHIRSFGSSRHRHIIIREDCVTKNYVNRKIARKGLRDTRLEISDYVTIVMPLIVWRNITWLERLLEMDNVTGKNTFIEKREKDYMTQDWRYNDTIVTPSWKIVWRNITRLEILSEKDYVTRQNPYFSWAACGFLMHSLTTCWTSLVFEVTKIKKYTPQKLNIKL